MAHVSIIVPFLNEAENIEPLYERFLGVAAQLPDDRVELILVDDGSTDGSVAAIRRLPRDPRLELRLVRLSRNFGSHAALAAGVSQAAGEVIGFISADLQDPPEIMLQLMAEWRKGGEVVWATRISREDPFIGRMFSAAYYKLLRAWALPQMPPGGVDLVVVDRKVVESLGTLAERNSSIFNLLMWAGFDQRFVAYKRLARQRGYSKWTFGKKIKLFVDSFFNFSFMPIRLISVLGSLISLLGLGYAAFIVARALLIGVAVPGWSSLMVVVLLCSGINLLMLGIISEYLWRTFDASRSRPPFIVREVEAIHAAVDPLPELPGDPLETALGARSR